MTLHLIKLCVGADSIEDLQAWMGERLEALRSRGERGKHVHVTRLTPRRRDELLAGGSLYWVIRGHIRVRQRLMGIHPVSGPEGMPRCGLELEPVLIETEWQPRRPFQGWRYLDAKDAPADLGRGKGADLPPELRAELAQLGLI